jgi:hypothetical protein
MQVRPLTQALGPPHSSPSDCPELLPLPLFPALPLLEPLLLLLPPEEPFVDEEEHDRQARAASAAIGSVRVSRTGNLQFLHRDNRGSAEV